MNKPKKGIVAWLSDVFGSSHKAISENLSAEQYNEFLKQAEKLQPEELEKEKTDPKNLESDQRISELEIQLGVAQSELEKEKGISATAIGEQNKLQQKLEEAEAKNKKLRQAVNPLGEEDISNQETNNNGLTQSDIAAREVWKNRSEE